MALIKKDVRRLSFFTTIIIVVFSCLYSYTPAEAQSGTDTQIIFAFEKKEQAREQLRRILSQYDLDPWIFTRVVNIDLGVDPHSKPVLTLNAKYLDEDLKQLSNFVHEQMHWFDDGTPDVVIEALRAMYPDPPTDDRQLRAYNHLIVGWLQLDAMAQLVGEEKARRIEEEYTRGRIEEPISALDEIYLWYNERVLEDTEEIGAILAEHGLLITPGKGLAADTSIARTQPQSSIGMQDGTDADITFVRELETMEAQTRIQLQRLFSKYDLDPWIFTQFVKIDPSQSYSVLTLSTVHPDNELLLLREFIRQQINWFVYYRYYDGQQAAIEDFKKMYPDPPNSGYLTYVHLILYWLELDAMSELLDKDMARRLVTDDARYEWSIERVLEDTKKIGAILAEHDLLITPKKGLVVHTGEK